MRLLAAQGLPAAQGGPRRLVWGPCAGRGGRVARVTSRPCCVGVAQPAEPQLRRGLCRARPGALAAPRGARAGPLCSAWRAGLGARVCGGASLGQQPRPPRGASCARGLSAGRRAGRGSGAREAGSAARSGREAPAPAGARRPRPGRPPASESSPCTPGPSPREPPPPIAALGPGGRRAARGAVRRGACQPASQPKSVHVSQPAPLGLSRGRGAKLRDVALPTDARAPQGRGRACRPPCFLLDPFDRYKSDFKFLNSTITCSRANCVL